MKWLGLARRAHITSGPSHISRYSYCRASTPGPAWAGTVRRSTRRIRIGRSFASVGAESETVPRPYRDREQRYVFNSTGGGRLYDRAPQRELGSIGPCISYNLYRLAAARPHSSHVRSRGPGPTHTSDQPSSALSVRSHIARGVALPSSTRHRDRRRSAAENALSPEEAGPAATGRLRVQSCRNV